MYYAQPNIAQNYFQYPNRMPYWNPAYCYSNNQSTISVPSNQVQADTSNVNANHDPSNVRTSTQDCAATNNLQAQMAEDCTRKNEIVSEKEITNESLPNAPQQGALPIQEEEFVLQPYMLPTNGLQDPCTNVPPPYQEIPNDEQAMNQAMQWPQTAQGYVYPPAMLPPTPVCSNCNNFMVPSWKCPSGHSEFAQLPITSAHSAFPQQIDPMQCTMQSPVLFPNVSNPVLQPQMVVPHAMMPTQSHMGVPHQPIWNQSQATSTQQTLPQVANQEQSQFPSLQQMTDSLIPAARPVSSTFVAPNVAVTPQNQMPSNDQKPGQFPIIPSARSEQHVQADAILQNSWEASKRTSESQQRFNRSFEHGLWNGQYNRRSNGLDPGYDHLTRSRMRLNSAEAKGIAAESLVIFV